MWVLVYGILKSGELSAIVYVLSFPFGSFSPSLSLFACACTGIWQSLRVHEVQKAGEEMVKEFEEKSEIKLTQKMSTYEEFLL